MAIGNNIKQLRLNRGITQEQLAEKLHISGQAVSKWENHTALPDITSLPIIADFFGVSIDELMDYKLNALTNKERFIKFMIGNGILQLKNSELKDEDISYCYINTEKFVTNAQIAKIGEYFADCIRENNIDFNVVMGMAYHGISFSAAAAFSLFQKYGMTVNYCHDRKVKDSRGRSLCGYSLKDGDKVVIIDDLISTGRTLYGRIDEIMKTAKIEISAVIVIVNRMTDNNASQKQEPFIFGEGSCANIYSIITDEDIKNYIKKI